MKDIQKLQIGDKIWHSSIGYLEVKVTCPICFGKKKVTLILGNGDQIISDCGYCSPGWESPQGYITEYQFVAEPQEITITGVNSCERDGEKEVNYYFNVNNYTGPENLFNTREEALVRCEEKIKENHQEELKRAGHKYNDSIRKFSSNTGYYVKKLNEHKNEISLLEEKIQIIRVKQKESSPDCNYNLKGKLARIKAGAYEELVNRNWHKGVKKENYDNETGVIQFEFGRGTSDCHISVQFKDEQIGFPPEFVDILEVVPACTG